jgi:hypothetical protein
MTEELLLRLTATHEASHATACIALGGKVDTVTVVQGAGYAGKMLPSLGQRQMKALFAVMLPQDKPIVAMEIDAEVRDCARRQIVEFLSGSVGEWCFHPGLSFQTDRRRRGSHDLKLATSIARGISATEEEAEALLSSSRAEARQILLAHRQLVEAIADALVRRGTLDGYDILELKDGVT